MYFLDKQKDNSQLKTHAYNESLSGLTIVTLG